MADVPSKIVMVSRRKVDKACLRCRRRKEKCDARQPACSPCQDSNNECIYTWQQKKRGLPEGWVHTLEKLFALAMAKYPDLEQFLLESVSNGVTERHHGFAALWTDQDHILGLRKRWRNSVLATRLESLMRDLERIAPRRLDSLQVSELVECIRTDPGLPQIGNAAEKSSARYSPVPSNLLELLERYFMYLHSWMPIFEKAYIYQLAYKLHGSWRELSKPELCCIFAILSNVQTMDVTRRNHEGTYDYSRLALQLVPRSSQDILPQHVQSLLLLGLGSIHAGVFEDAWLLLGSACQTRSIVARRQGGHEANSAARIHHGCFVLDALLSARLQLPSHFDTEEWDSISYTLSRDGLEEWSPANHYFKACLHSCPSRINSTFNQLFDMVHIFRSVSETHSVEEREILWQRLQDHRSPCANPSGGKTQPPMLPSQVTARLVYLAATLRFHETIDLPVDIHFEITNSLLPLREYVRSTVQPLHIPSIWEFAFSILLDLLQARFTNGDNASRSSIDAIIAAVAELEDKPYFRRIKDRCTTLDRPRSPSKIEYDAGLPRAGSDGQQIQQQMENSVPLDQQMGIAALEQQPMNLVTTNALDAEVDWDATLLNLGFANGENINELEMMTPDLYFQ